MGEDSTSSLPGRKYSSALNVRTLPRRLQGSLPEVFHVCVRSEKPTYPKVYKWLQNIEKLQK